MTWSQKVLQLPPALSPISAQVTSAHPWVPGLGRHEKSGGYLDPRNALSWLGGQLRAAGSVPLSCHVLMVTAHNHGDFMSRLNGLAGVLPLPDVRQVTRLAQAFSALESDRLVLPPALHLPPVVQTLSSEVTRELHSAQRAAKAALEAALPASLADLRSTMSGFVSTRDALLAALKKTASDLQALTVPAHVFSMTGLPATIAREMMTGLPVPDAVHTLAMMFTGDDLSALEVLFA